MEWKYQIGWRQMMMISKKVNLIGLLFFCFIFICTIIVANIYINYFMTDIKEKNIEEVKSFSSEVIDFLKDLVVIFAIVLVVRTFIAVPFQINGQSMNDSYYNREFIIVDRLSYIIWDVKRWDVVVFRPWVSKDREFFLKRIIGLPWDTLAIEDGKVYLKEVSGEDFVELDEKYLNDTNYGNTFISGSKSRIEYKVPEGSYFVMGDNRNHSTDSRQCFSSCSLPWAIHYTKKENITGRLFLDLWYFNFKKFSFIHPESWIDTFPRFLNSPRNYEYEGLLSDR